MAKIDVSHHFIIAKRMQNDVLQDDVMRDAKWSHKCHFKFK